MSPAAAAVTGYEPAELYADPSLMFGRIHPDDRDAAIAQIQDPHSANRHLRMRWQHKNGTWVWTDHRVVPIRDDEGQLIGAEGIARDVTEEVRAEEQLLESERLSRSVMESIPGPTLVLDASGTIVMINHAWDEYVQSHGGAELDSHGVGADYVALCEDAAARGIEGAADVAAAVRAVLSGTQQSVRLDYPAAMGDGDRWFLLRVSPLRTAHGGVVVLHTDITERKRHERELTYQALHDGLTGLPNRALLEDRLEVALRRARARHSLNMGLLVVDLDRFKSVNDAFGNGAGDLLLTAVSARLMELVRPGDTVARLGGDEFAVLCEGVSGRGEVEALADRIVGGLAEPFGQGTAEEVLITASVGAALGVRDIHGEVLLRDADAAMYRAKERGRNCYAFSDQSLHARTVSRLSIEADLRRALEQDELQLVYQPVVDLATETITGVEALLRWQHPSRGVLAPDEFLEVAEETGVIIPIGDWVLREACRQQRAWLIANPDRDHFDIAVNVSAQQMRRPQFVEDVLAAVADSAIQSDHLVLELTETALMEADVAPNADRLHAAGIRLAVDDFGIGYSSLSYLKRFPVDIVKIDKSFVDGLQRNPEDTAIVEAIIGMTKALALTAIAEGVEHEQQSDTLLALGCERAQGYLFSRARSPSVIGRLLQTGLPRKATGRRRPPSPHLLRHG
jgi:diguanylate cyclase (GGDEF)-like protein/PAS domain S-box-containing protein